MKDAAARLTEEALYEQVAAEISAGVRREGLWAKAIVDSGGSPNAARATYIRLRVQSLIDEIALNAESEKNKAAAVAKADQEREAEIIRIRVEEIKKQQEEENKAITQKTLNATGKFLYGFLSLVVFIVIISVVGQIFQGTLKDSWFLLFIVIFWVAVLWFLIMKFRENNN